MSILDKFLKSVAFILKPLNLPHILKYGLFLFLKTRNIPVRTSIKISNAKMDLNLGDFIDYWIFMDGSYEGEWISKIEKLVTGKTFIDIGANIGIYSLSLYKKAKYIYAFEPEKENYKRLTQNLKINSIKNVETFKCAISNSKSKSARLYTSKNDKGWNSLSIKYTGGIQKVNSITLDYFVSRNRIRDIGLIKIDVEGAELDVLKGSSQIFTRLHPPLLIEFNGPRSQLSGYGLKDMYELMRKYNYRCYRLANNRLIPFKISNLSGNFNENVLFIK